MRADDIRQVYSAVAVHPAATHPFVTGPAFAAAAGYPAGLLARAPLAAASFAGLSAVSVWADIHPGARLLDLGCGAGLDSFVAAGRGAAITGVDFSRPMLLRASRQLPAAHFVEASAGALPFAAQTFDGALINGIFNLSLERAAIFAALYRVLRPGAVVHGAELVLRQPLPPGQAASPADWFA